MEEGWFSNTMDDQAMRSIEMEIKPLDFIQKLEVEIAYFTWIYLRLKSGLHKQAIHQNKEMIF